MRNIVIIAMLLAAASTAGWFSINRDGDHLQIDINRAEVRNDTRTMIERGREILARQQQAANSQTPAPAQPWPQAQGDSWGGNTAAGYPPERGFGAPPPNFGNNAPAGYPANTGYNPATYLPPTSYSPATNDGQQSQAGYPDTGYPRQAAPYSPQPTYPR